MRREGEAKDLFCPTILRPIHLEPLPPTSLRNNQRNATINMSVTAADWGKGIGYSILASVVGGASKLAIRKSWIMVKNINNATSTHTHTHTRAHARTRTRTVSGDQENNYENPDPASLHASDSSHNLEIDTSPSPSPSPSPSARSTPPSPCTVSERRTRTNKSAIALRLSGMIGMTFINPLFCVLAMNYASPSILAPFSGLTLVWIVLFSENMIGEKPTRQQIIAACLIVFGEVIVAVWGDHTNDEDRGLEDVVNSYKSPYFLMYFGGMVCWIAALVYMIIKRPTPALRRFAWGVSGGSITGFQNFLKDSLTIVKAVGETGEPYPWYFYIMILLAVATSFSGLLFLTSCMKRYDATFSSAMFVGSFVISASIMSAVHYQTFQHLESIWNWILYPTGLIVLMAGVRMLVNATSEQDLEFEVVNLRRQGSSGSSSSTEMVSLV